MKRIVFPDSFIFGAATSAAQVEGGASEEWERYVNLGCIRKNPGQ